MVRHFEHVGSQAFLRQIEQAQLSYPFDVSGEQHPPTVHLGGENQRTFVLGGSTPFHLLTRWPEDAQPPAPDAATSPRDERADPRAGDRKQLARAAFRRPARRGPDLPNVQIGRKIDQALAVI